MADNYCILSWDPLCRLDEGACGAAEMFAFAVYDSQLTDRLPHCNVTPLKWKMDTVAAWQENSYGEYDPFPKAL